jgi:hypothetical protein
MKAGGAISMRHRLFQPDPVWHKTVTDSSGTTKDALGDIRCPHCQWRPQPSSRWCCRCLHTPEPPFVGCGTLWNTFATAGVCPGCGHRWQWTSCHRCHGWALHVDWYEQAAGGSK